MSLITLLQEFVRINKVVKKEEDKEEEQYFENRDEIGSWTMRLVKLLVLFIIYLNMLLGSSKEEYQVV